MWSDIFTADSSVNKQFYAQRENNLKVIVGDSTAVSSNNRLQEDHMLGR